MLCEVIPPPDGEVYWCGVNWRNLCEVILFWSEVQWFEVSYVDVLGDRSVMYIGWPCIEGNLLYCDYFIWCVSCTVVVLTCFVICGCGMCGFCNVWMCVCVGVCMYGFCNVWMCVCVGVCMYGFCNVWMCGFCNVWVFWQLCGCFGNKRFRIVSFMYIYSYLLLV